METNFARCVAKMEASKSAPERRKALRETKKCVDLLRERPSTMDGSLQGAVTWLMEDLSQLTRRNLNEADVRDSNREKNMNEGEMPESMNSSVECEQKFVEDYENEERGPMTAHPVDLAEVREQCKLILELVTARGWKAVMRCMPHEARDLEGAARLLFSMEKKTAGFRHSGDQPRTPDMLLVIGTNTKAEQEVEREVIPIVQSNYQETNSVDRDAMPTGLEDDPGPWENVGEVKCVLLLWLCVLVLLPFDIAVVDSNRENANAGPLEEELIEICKNFLSTPGNLRDMAALLLSRLLSRRDMKAHLLNFCRWCVTQVLNSDLDPHSFLIPGIAHTMAHLFKMGSKDSLAEVANEGWKVAEALFHGCKEGGSTLVRKLSHKLVQRVVLAMLPAATASWKYDRRMTSLLFDDVHHQPKQSQELELVPLEECEDYNAPEFLEAAIEMLLSGLMDRDTVVRWSAAKGLGRISSRLSLTLASDVVEAVVDILSPVQNDSAWHGGCLALAELARRGLLLPKHLEDVVPKVVLALAYDVRRGPHSVGAHVRDAACYVCWAFARAYDPEVMKKPALQLAPALLVTACYDREVHCRRAASAAFQEAVGRQGATSFAHGIEIITAADYVTVGPRQRSYLEVAPFVGQFPEYTEAFVDHLVFVKLRHWECSLRELAAKALRRLCVHANKNVLQVLFEAVIPLCTDPQLEVRHGAVCGVAEALIGLAEFIELKDLEDTRIDSITNILVRVVDAKLCRGKGGELMRTAICKLILSISMIKLPVRADFLAQAQSILDENLAHPNSEIQKVAAEGLRVFLRTYFIADHGYAQTLVSKYCSWLSTKDNPPRRRGGALALAAIPASLYADSSLLQEATSALCSSSTLGGDSCQEDAETRVNSVKAIGEMYGNLRRESSTSPTQAITAAMYEQVFSTLLLALDDYSVDNRGDVGSWVREAAIKSMEEFLAIDRDIYAAGGVVDRHRIETLALGQLVKQALERIDRLRGFAGSTVATLLQSQSTLVCYAAHVEELQGILLETGSCEPINWSSPAESFPRLVKLIAFEAYRKQVMSGLVLSIGGLCQHLSSIASDALFAYMSEASAPPLPELAQTLLEVWRPTSGVDRITVPLMNTLDKLYTRTELRQMGASMISFHAEVLELTRAEGRGSKDVKKLIIIANVLCHLCLTHEPVSSQALSVYMVLLGNRFPKVRQYAAEQLYITMLMVDETEDQYAWATCTDIALEVLSECPWESNAEVAKEARDKIRAALPLQDAPKSRLVAPSCT
mmetsp:Transcript_3749/g.23580  ORF Transcript_3749/g.23580 Transcript_3749/m.23580 type:complete len:1267 (-) Transcript_3749:1594-5394(-)